MTPLVEFRCPLRHTNLSRDTPVFENNLMTNLANIIDAYQRLTFCKHMSKN